MGAKKIQVRRAEPKDVVNICKLLKNGWNEQTVEYAPIDDMRGYRWILAIIEEGFVVVADLNGRIVGAACGSPYVPAWSKQWLLDMEFIYVLPSFRDADVTKMLMGAVVAEADRVKLPMTFGIQTGDKPLVKDRLMRIAGWTYVGGNFLRQSEHGQEQE
jgi:GNAT superfamily N-acetyltransferase